MAVPPTVLITGATSGIGLELAHRYHAAAARLLLVGRQPLKALSDPLFSRHPYCCCDLSDPDCAALVTRCLSDAGITTLDLLVHNAAIGYYGAVASESPEILSRLLAVNLYAPLLLTRALLPQLRRAHGTLAFISSVAADLPVPDYAVYGATKAALSGFARNLRLELPGVQVAVIYPGATRSELHAKSGVPAGKMRWERFPSAAVVARKIQVALDNPRLERSIGAANTLLRFAGRHFEGPIDVMAGRRRGRLRPSEISEPGCCAITGAASGIGLALARAFAARGYRIIGMDRDRVRVTATTRAFEERGIDSSWVIADLSSDADLQRVLGELPELDVLVHSAGINAVGPFADSNPQEQRAVLDVNLRAPLLLTQGVLERGLLHPKRGAWGGLVFISSLSHYLGYPGASAYAASKDGLASYARSLGVALSARGIQVLSVFPGPTRTPHARRYSPDNSREERRMPPERLAADILTALAQRRSRLVPGLPNKFLTLAGHLLPGVTGRVMKRTIFDRL